MSNLLQNISWAQYLLYAGGAAIVYYAVVILLYFRKNIRQKFSPSGNTDQAGYGGGLSDSELTDDLETIVNEIGHSILVPGNRATRAELLEQLKASVANYDGLGRPGYRYALNNYIIEKARENCGTNFSEEELDEAWDGLSR